MLGGGLHCLRDGPGFPASRPVPVGRTTEGGESTISTATRTSAIEVPPFSRFVASALPTTPG